ncbi:hypothetical protein ABPG75_007360 [Micractinium tetrahymenae]
MSDVDDSLIGALARAGVEAAKLVRKSAEEAAAELSGALGADQIKLPAGLLGRGPMIPGPYKRPGQGITWQDGYMASCALSVARAVQQHDLQPVTALAVGAQALLHARPQGYRLTEVGLNAHRVLDRREWRRLATAPVLHADLPHLASNCTGLVLEGLPLERRLGSVRFAALLGSCALLSQGLYLLSARLARDWLPRSSMADHYFRSYAVGFSAVALALKVIAGYMREADLAAARVAPSEEFLLTAGRLSAWPALLLSHYLLPAASLPGHLCGIATGVLHVYGGRALGWLMARLRLGNAGGGRRRLQGGRLLPGGRGPAGLGAFGHPGLGWMDLGSHLLLGAGTALSAKTAMGGSLKVQAPSSRKSVNTVVVASSGKKIDISKQGLNSIENETVKLNLMGRSKTMESKGWVDPQGRKGKGYGVYRFANKYGANVDGYSPIYTPDTWSESGDSYKLGTKGLIAWAGLIVVLLGVGINLVISTSALGQ